LKCPLESILLYYTALILFNTYRAFATGLIFRTDQAYKNVCMSENLKLRVFRKFSSGHQSHV